MKLSLRAAGEVLLPSREHPGRGFGTILSDPRLISPELCHLWVPQHLCTWGQAGPLMVSVHLTPPRLRPVLAPLPPKPAALGLNLSFVLAGYVALDKPPPL